MTSCLTALFREVARSFSQDENHILLGQKSGSISGIQERSGVDKVLSGEPQHSKAADKKLSDLLYVLDIMNNYMKRLADEIEAMENRFRDRHGDEWREKLALKILDEDDIPQRREGESMEQYRERLEPLLIAELLNRDGSIKSEYKNHPELGDYAQWAQKQYHLNAARGYVQELESPNTPQQRINEIFEELKNNDNFEELTLTDRQLHQNEPIRSMIDSSRDDKLQGDHSDNLNSFLSFKS